MLPYSANLSFFVTTCDTAITKTQDIVVEWRALLRHIRVALGTNLSVKTGCFDGLFSGVLQFLAKAGTIFPVRQRPHLFSGSRVNFSL
jgi:hypothetical protein